MLEKINTLANILFTLVIIGGGIILVSYVVLFKNKRKKLKDELQNFFNSDPSKLPIVARSFSQVDLPNIHLAMQKYSEEKDANYSTIGYTSSGGYGSQHGGLRGMIAYGNIFDEVSVCSVQYRDVDIDMNSQMQCVVNGIHLIETTENKFAVNVYSDQYSGSLEVEVMGASKEGTAQFLEKIREHALHSNVYRHKVISLDCDTQSWGGRGHTYVRFHKLPSIPRENIILPEETMQLIERNTTSFFQHANLLKQSGRSVKRGILLHGKPGTGKTYTVKWLSQSLQEVTVIIMAAEQLRFIKECCQIARLLAPSLIVLEDVDLVARERDQQQNPAHQVVLHQLLNEMDGIASDAEVIFIMTTNRPDAIEPALAARPGRVDQAIEYPLPDAECRKRLVELYGRGLKLELSDMERIITKTEGASPAFIQELMRKAALIAAEERSLHDGTLKVNDGHLEAALRELVLGGGELTRNLLGFSANPPQ